MDCSPWRCGWTEGFLREETQPLFTPSSQCFHPRRHGEASGTTSARAAGTKARWSSSRSWQESPREWPGQGVQEKGEDTRGWDGCCCLLPQPPSTPWEKNMPAELLQSSPTLCHPMDHSPPGSSVHGILQERVTVPSSRGSSPPRDRTCVFYIYSGRRVLYH